MDVFNLLAKIGLDTSEYDSGLSRIASGVGSAAKMVGKAVSAGTAVVSAFAISSVQAGADFDSAMSQVAATAGKTMDELNSEINTTKIGTEEFTGTLREFAQYMGSTTAFSATEAADALNYMALAGYDAQTSMDMLPTVLNLAAAGGIELASASDMVTDAQTALGLSLEETSAMVDQMALASSKSNTSVEQLGEAFLTIGANARGLSGGTEELSTMLGVLADNGIKGGEAGTHLRNIMLALNPTTDAAAAAWEELGVQAYDAEGNMRPLNDIMVELGDAMADMSEQEKSQTLSDMFNKTDLAAVNALIGTSKDRYDELQGSIGKASGAADKMAKTQLDNLAGDITLFKSALEGAKIAVSDELTPTIREFVEFGSEGLSEITQAFQEDGLAGAMEVLGNLLSELLNKIIEKLPEMVDAGMRLLSALGQGLLDNLPLLIDSAIQIVGMIGKSLISPDNIQKILDAALTILFSLIDGLIAGLPTLIPAVMEIITKIVDTLFDPENISRLINAALDILVILGEGFMDNVDKLVDAVFKIITALTRYLTDPENLAKLIETAIKLVVTIGAGLVKAIPQLALSVLELILDIKDRFTNTDWGSLGKNIVDGLLNGLKNAWSKLTSWFSESIKSLVSGVESLLGIASPSKVFAGIGGYMAEGLGEGWNDEIDAVKNGINSDLDFSAVPATATINADGITGNKPFELDDLTDAVKSALDSFEIKWDDRNLGRLVKTYA